jgi:hypothetical protein
VTSLVDIRKAPIPRYVLARLLALAPLGIMELIASADSVPTYVSLGLVYRLEARGVVPARIICVLLLKLLSIAASKDLMVSSGRSMRGRVGFVESGSASGCVSMIYELGDEVSEPIGFPSESRY